MFADTFIHHLTTLPDYDQQIVYTQHIPPSDARFGSLKRPLNPLLQSRLEALGMSSLYTHQALAINSAVNGNHFRVAADHMRIIHIVNI